MNRLLALLVALLAIVPLASAQTVVGRISGTVVDPTGAAVPAATIIIKNEATGVARTATTNDRGYYVAPNLQPGMYTVAVEVQGFKRVAKSGWDLVADGRLSVDFTLQVGDVTSTVEVVEAAGETVNTVSGEVSRTIDSSQVQDLALNARNYLQLASLIPGAILLNDDQLSLTTGLGTTGAALNGNRPNSSNITADGAYNLDAGSNGSQINNVGLDFIREVQVKTSNFSAEYGRQSGASINVVTRSGGNQFHGSAYEFLRNDKLDARNFFSPSKPSLRFNNFGWSLGGPILKGKLFFFGGQEWKYIRRYTDPTRRTLPTRAERAGDFSRRSGTLNLPGTSTPVPNRNISSLMTADGRAIAKVYDRMESLATTYVDTPTSNNAIYQLSNPFQVRQDVGRLDYRINDKHSVYLRYMHDDYDVVDPLGSLVTSQLPTIPGRRLRPATSWQVSHTWMISPHLFNEAKSTAGWHSQRVFMDGDNWQRDQYGFAYKELYQGGGRYSGIPSVSINGFSSFTGPTYYVSTSTDISATDSLTWIRGSHTVKTGFLVTRNRKDANGRPPLNGSIAFNASGNAKSSGNALADAMLGVFRTYSESEYDPIGFFRFSQFDAYVTDQWKATRNLNFEVGMRFQAIWPAYATGNNLTNFVPALYDPAKAVTLLPNGSIVPGSGFIYNGLIRAGDGVPEDQVGRIPDARSERVLSVPTGAPRGFYNPAYPVAPRFSFAWAPGHDGKTAVRGGFGMFYDRNDLTAIVQGPLASPPFAESVQYENGYLADPTSGAPTARGVISGVRPIDPNLKTPYTINYSLGIQRQLRDGLFLETAYVGNVSHHLMRQADINQPSWSDLAANNSLPSTQRATNNYLRRYKGFAELPTRVSDANSNYNGLQVYLTRRKGWLTGTVSYTFSKALTDASSNTEASEEPGDRRFNYGPASFDRRHAFVTTVNARLPFFKTGPAWRKNVLGGWELSAIGRYQSGPYFSITSSTAVGTRRADYNGQAVALSADERGPNRWFNTAAFTAPPITRGGNTGAGIVQGPGLQIWDLSFRKQFRINERFNLRYQADLFNALNKANLRGLTTATTSAGFGSLTTSGPGRNIQMGLRLGF
jgi:hypothetical protein